MSNGFIYVVDAHFIDKIEKINPGPKCLWKKMVRDSREKKWMPCVVGRIYLAGSLVVLERGVRVRRNCNIFNLAMENVLKGLPDKISCPDIIQMYTFFNHFQIARSWRWNRFQWWKKPEYPESKLYHLRLRVECTLLVIYKAGANLRRIGDTVIWCYVCIQFYI